MGALLLSIAWMVPAHGQQIPVQDGFALRAEPIGEVVRAGRWAPLRVTVLNQGDATRAEVRVEERSGGRTAVYERTVELPEAGRRDIVLLYRPGTSRAKRTVTVRTPTRQASTGFAVRQAGEDAATVGVLGKDTLGLQFLQDTTGGRIPGRVDRGVREDPRSVHTGLIEPGALPRHSAAWEGFDQLVWPAADPSGMPPDSQRALLDWVADGGHLTLFVAETVGGFRGAPLADALPHAIDRVDDHDDLAPLPWPVPTRLPVSVGDGSVSGTVLLSTGDGTPLWSIRRYGLGTVALLSFDPRQLPLTTADARTAFWRDVLHLPRPGTSITDGRLPRTLLHAPAMAERPGPPADEGVELLRAHLSDIPGVAPLPLRWLLVFSGVYLVIIGPVEWFVLKRLRRRPLTWITFPFTILVFSTVALVGTARIKGDQAVVTSVEVVDVLPGTDRWRGRTYIGVFSTANRRLTLTHDAPDSVTRPATEPGYADDVVVSAGLGPGEAAWTQETWTLGYATTRWVAPGQAAVLVEREGDGWVVHNRLDQPLRRVALYRDDRMWSTPSVAPGERRPLSDDPPDDLGVLGLTGVPDGEGVLVQDDFDGLLIAETDPLQPPVIGGLRPALQRRTVLRVPLLDPESRR